MNIQFKEKTLLTESFVNVIAAKVLLGSRTVLVAALCVVAPLSMAQAQLPSENLISSQKAKQADSIRSALEQVGGMTAPPGTVKAEAPPNFGTPEKSAKKEDLNDLIKRFNNGKPVQAKKGTSDLMVFVSLSMPERVLKELSQQAKAAGAVMILRGVKDQSLKATKEAAYAVNPGMAEWEIAPDLFKQFKIKSVPAFVVADSSANSVLDDGCSPDVSFASVAGEMSIEQALNIIRIRARPQQAQLAEKRLAMLKRM